MILIFIFITGIICIIIFPECLTDVLADRIKKNYPEIKSIIISNDLDRRAIDISFHNNKRIILENANAQLGGDMRIKRIGKFGFEKYGRYSSSPTVDVSILENELNVKFNNINDIINNYSLIYDYAASLERRDSEKYSDYSGGLWVWDKNDIKKIEFKGKWYAIFSYSMEHS
jgi:hypothetical protein